MENANFKTGNVNSPLSTTYASDVLKNVDPVVYNILEFYSGAIRLHCQDLWNSVITNLGLTNLSNKIVNQKLGYDPLPFAQDTQYAFPFLASYRNTETYNYKTISYHHIISNIDVLYVMPPLSADQMEYLNPFLAHITRTICDRTLETFDSNLEGGKKYWQEAKIEQIDIKKSTFGKIPDLNTNLHLPSVLMQLEVMERWNTPDTTNFELYNGMDSRIKIHTDGYDDYNIIDIKT